MTEEEKKKMLAGFQKPPEIPEQDTYWTEDRLRETAKRIIKRLHLEGELQ